MNKIRNFLPGLKGYWQRLSLWERVAGAGLFLYAAFAPHSIAGAEIALAIVFAGWLGRAIATGRWRGPHTPVGVPLALFLAWTVLSSAFSYEPYISLRKLQSVLVFGALYLARATARRAWVVPLAGVLLLSGAVGALWSVIDVARGRGVVIEAIAEDSPYHATLLQAGDAVWRVGGRRVASVAEIDAILQSAPAGTQVSLSAVAKGEHAEWPGIVVTDELRQHPSPSGLGGTQATHRFRASGWTRHYETFAEILQMVAQVALGLMLAYWSRRRDGWAGRLAGAATLILLVGIALTAMRTALVAFSVGALVTAWRVTGRTRARVWVVCLLCAALALGAWTVARTRAGGALRLGDDSSSLRLQLAEAGARRVTVRPLLGHGLDAVKLHWREWGFPGDAIIHTHSTPLQIAFERGLPALLLWLWLMLAAWRMTARAESAARDDVDAAQHGVLLGILGALTGFAASSLVNYNWGDAEVILLFWWLLGLVTVNTYARTPEANAGTPGRRDAE